MEEDESLGFQRRGGFLVVAVVVGVEAAEDLKEKKVRTPVKRR